jgi:hypothetical protein
MCYGGKIVLKRKLITVFVLVAVLCLAVASAYAAPALKVFVDGREIVGDTPAQIIDGRTMVPVRFVSEALGANVSWDQAANSVIITSKPNPQQLNLMKLNGEPTTWPYWYENGVLYMEPRNLLELFRIYKPHPNYIFQYFKNSHTLILANKPYENVPYLKKGDFLVFSLKFLKDQKEINFDWDEQNSNLIIKPI